MTVRAFPILQGILLQHLIYPLHITIPFNLYALMKLVIKGGISVGTIVTRLVGHAIGVVLVINAVASTTKKEHAAEAGERITEIIGIMCVLKDIKSNFLI